MREKNFKLSLFVTAIAFLAIAISSCSDKDEKARLSITLTDSPGDYEAVNVEVIGVEILINSDDESNGWTLLDVEDSIFNLIALTNGVEATLSDVDIEPGRLSQLRLLLGDQNSVVIDGDTIALSTPSAQQSGLKIQINEDLVAGVTYSIKLDFDAAQSVVKAGNSGKYNLKPVIKTIIEATSGAIRGTVTPDSLSVAIYAIQGSDTIGASYAPADEASYLIEGLPEGNYDLTFDPGEESGFISTTVGGIDVSTGEVKEVDPIELVEM